jgi:hypothetical protein
VSPCAALTHRGAMACQKRASAQNPLRAGRAEASRLGRCSSDRCFPSEVRGNRREVCVARYYDPATGQFLSLDPDVAQTLAPFNYAGDDPINDVDPAGLSWTSWIPNPFAGDCIRYVTCPGSTPRAPIDQEIANAAGGVLNGITFGNGRTVASWFGVQCNGDWSSTATEIGTVVGSGLDFGLGPEEVGEDLVAEGTRIPDAILDATGRVHGVLPSPADLAQYDPEALATLRDELVQSVQTRIANTVQLGADYGHSERIAEEQALIKSIDKYLADH